MPRDADGIIDVYEYVDGRPQLISTGIGENNGAADQIVGLVGVSADGIDAFFSTYETLVGQDKNGPFYKFYDARTGGGFRYIPPQAPCAAADECHGPGSSSPAAPQFGTVADLGSGGNAHSNKNTKKKKHKRKKRSTRRVEDRTATRGVSAMVEQPTNRTIRVGRLTTLVAGLVCSALLAALALNAGSAHAAATVESFSNGPSATQAGGHPDILTSFVVGSRYTQGSPPDCQCADPKDVTVHMPTGVVGNPHVASRCGAAEQATFECPPDAQVGVVAIELPFFGWFVVPLYNAVPHTDQAGLLTFEAPFVLAVPQYLVLNGRTGSDYGLDSTLSGISQIVPPSASDVILWGVPSASSHDSYRFPRGHAYFAWGCTSRPTALAFEGVVPGFCEYGYSSEPILPIPSGLPAAPFLQNPTTCTGPLPTTLEVVSYDHGVETAEGVWPATTGCDLLSFNPSLSAKPTTEETDAPSGLDVTLTVPQTQDPVTPAPSQIRTVRMTLPAGVSLNSNAADGKVACSEADARFGTLEEARCPEFSKVGTAVLDSSVLPGPISGAVYIGDPKPGDRYRVILTADGFNTAREAVRVAAGRPRHGPADRCVRRPAPDPLPGIQAALLRIRARHPRDSDALWDV